MNAHLARSAPARSCHAKTRVSSPIRTSNACRGVLAKIYSIRSHQQIERAKAWIGQGEPTAIEFFRPGVGVRHAWVTFVPARPERRSATSFRLLPRIDWPSMAINAVLCGCLPGDGGDAGLDPLGGGVAVGLEFARCGHDRTVRERQFRTAGRTQTSQIDSGLGGRRLDFGKPRVSFQPTWVACLPFS
jgi:hypothetical protein